MFRGSRVVLEIVSLFRVEMIILFKVEMISLFKVEMISLRFIQRESRGLLIYLRNQGQGSKFKNGGVLKGKLEDRQMCLI